MASCVETDDDPLDECPPLHTAAEENDIKAASEILFSSSSDVNEFWDSETSLHVCCRLGHRELAEMLIDHGADCNYITENRHESPLYLASREGHEDLVKLLVEKGACIEGNKGFGLEAIYCTAIYGCVKVLRYLIQQGVSFEDHHMPYGHTPLTCACRHGHKIIVQELLSVGADVNKPMSNGHCGVFLATMFQYSDIVRMLVKAGATLNGYSVQFQACPLHIACSNGDIDTTKALLEGDCDVNIIQDKGQTPLYIAVELGFLDIVDLLIKHGADPDIDTLDTGNTPIFASFEKAPLSDFINTNKPSVILVRHLVQAGCNVDHENQSGVTPLQAALDKQNCEAAMILLAADCSVHSECWFTSEMDVYIISLENEYSQLYATFMNELKNPRSLKRLCRVTLRNSLRQRLPYAETVTLLPLPKRLQQFISYENL